MSRNKTKLHNEATALFPSSVSSTHGHFETYAGKTSYTAAFLGQGRLGACLLFVSELDWGQTMCVVSGVGGHSVRDWDIDLKELP